MSLKHARAANAFLSFRIVSGESLVNVMLVGEYIKRILNDTRNPCSCSLVIAISPGQAVVVGRVALKDARSYTKLLAHVFKGN